MTAHRCGGRARQEGIRRLRTARGARSGWSGLGPSGSRSPTVAQALGMKVLGYDPQITVQRAWQLSSSVAAGGRRSMICSRAPTSVSVHVPLHACDARPGECRALLRLMRPGGVLLNFARARSSMSAAVIAALDARAAARLRVRLPDARRSRPTRASITLPHLGASTLEAEENCAIMVAEQAARFPRATAISGTASTFRRRCCRGCPAPRASRSPTATCRTWWARSRPASPAAQLNIADLLNKSRGEYAYTLIDTDGEVGRCAARADPRDRRACSPARIVLGQGGKWMAKRSRGKPVAAGARRGRRGRKNRSKRRS